MNPAAKPTPKATNWLCTLNNPDEVPHEFLERVYKQLNAVYVCGQLEKGEEGTAHIQFFINLKKPGQRMSALKKVIPRAHFEIVRINNGADDYCLKQDTRVEGPWEFGTKPVKRNSKVDWDRVKEQALKGEFMAINSQVLIQHYGNLRRIYTDFQPSGQIKRESMRQCFWFWGPTRTGKTCRAYGLAPDGEPVYQKLAEVAWNRYQGEKYAVYDEADIAFVKKNVNEIKRWSDPWWNHPADVKYSAIRQNHDVFAITSQFSPEQCNLDVEDYRAILARFKVVHCTEPWDPVKEECRKVLSELIDDVIRQAPAGREPLP